MLLALAVSGAAFAQHFSDAERTCPIGGETFTHTGIGMRHNDGMLYDMMPIGIPAGPQPMPQCRGNGFAVYKEFTDAEVAALAPFVESDEYRALVTTETPYYLAYVLSERLRQGGAPDDILLLSATWEADEEQYARYVEELLPLLAAKEGSEDPDSNAWWDARVLQAELNRRTGAFGAARGLLDLPDAAPTERHAIVRLQLLELIDAEIDRPCALYWEGETRAMMGYACWTETTPALR